MVIGAGWAGARSFTSTAGPGISLMQEFIGLAYYTEIPGVFFDIQRTGPSTGMPTRTQQGDLLSIAYASHGDTKHIVLFPANPEECFYAGRRGVRSRRAIPDAGVRRVRSRHRDERLDVPALQWDDSYRPDRGKVLGAEELEKVEKFSRYLDVDGDGIAARTLPGVHPQGRVFHARLGTHKHGTYTEDSAEYQEVVDRLAQKFETAATGGAGTGDSSTAPTDADDRHHRDRRLSRARCSRRSTALRDDGHRRRLHAHPRVPVRPRRARVHRGAPAVLRRRAEPRRAAALAARDRDRHRRATNDRPCSTTAACRSPRSRRRRRRRQEAQPVGPEPTRREAARV